MKILITCPGLSPHGGIRIILEWANRLQDLGHKVTLLCKEKECSWFNIRVPVCQNVLFSAFDCLIVTSPHDVHLLDQPKPLKKFVFVQMLEHLFRPTDIKFYEKCIKFYTTKYPLISISKWNIDSLQKDFGRTGVIHYVGNGINLEDFPISYKEKDNRTILLESPEPTNNAKDVDRLALKVGSYLKQLGYRITGYGLKQPDSDIFDEFFIKPDLITLNRLYEDAFLMIKATRYDARSTAPIEAMTKGCVTVRAIDKGDDDLNWYNSYRCGYDEKELMRIVDIALHENRKADSCRYYAQSISWENIMPQINSILCN